MSHLPIRIMHMVKELHDRGYSSVYLYCGLSPSGMHWRYEIGQTEAGQWPVSPPWIKSSLGSSGETKWAKDNSSVALMTYGFQQSFKDKLKQNYKPTPYSQWYADVLSGLGEQEVLQFYADYGGKHQHLLETAPGFSKQVKVY